MKSIYLLIIFSFFSCSNSENPIPTSTCKLERIEAGALFYEYIDFDDAIGFATTFEGVLLNYDNSGRISTINGGPTLVASGSNQDSWLFTNIPSYTVFYEDNTVSINHNVTFFDSETLNTYSINNDKIISRNVVSTLNYFNYELAEYTYQYFDDYIEESRNNELFRTLFFENNNLVKIEQLRYGNIEDPLGEPNTLVGKTDYIFSDYDTNENLMKGLFFLDGAFYKAFSNNNYQKISRYNYNYSDGEFTPSGNESFRSFNYGTNEDGTNGMFQQNCD
jgi:hypothetical protein